MTFHEFVSMLKLLLSLDLILKMNKKANKRGMTVFMNTNKNMLSAKKVLLLLIYKKNDTFTFILLFYTSTKVRTTAQLMLCITAPV